MSRRLFFAIELGSPAGPQLRRLAENLKGSQADVRWIGEEPLHLTLAFLGKVEEEKIPLAIRAAQRCAARGVCFDAVFSEIGVFPSWEHPRVIWAGSKIQLFRDLAQSLREELRDEKFTLESDPFVAHITLGRFRSGGGKDRLKIVAKEQQFRAQSRVYEIVLFESRLKSEGAEHEALSRFPLGASAIAQSPENRAP